MQDLLQEPELPQQLTGIKPSQAMPQSVLQVLIIAVQENSQMC
jgi:hypothetical protein